jgi:hypothetical protein
VPPEREGRRERNEGRIWREEGEGERVREGRRMEGGSVSEVGSDEKRGKKTRGKKR